MTSAITIRSTILLFMVLLLDTRHVNLDKRNREHFHESRSSVSWATPFLDVVTVHLVINLRKEVLSLAYPFKSGVSQGRNARLPYSRPK